MEHSQSEEKALLRLPAEITLLVLSSDSLAFGLAGRYCITITVSNSLLKAEVLFCLQLSNLYCTYGTPDPFLIMLHVLR